MFLPSHARSYDRTVSTCHGLGGFAAYDRRPTIADHGSCFVRDDCATSRDPRRPCGICYADDHLDQPAA